ncbi:tyrosine phosphatase family protein [Limoniibacter endophyticus]|uniref:Protein-tyrosine-phosphatase n=1 Tax=Limoniibacter endophyticus TaxID=1565040 RepID=A0A8J3GIG8_9HYPH|nr:protein tyrosine phosphatase [Limoniibacter endophyticus]GHC78394.1 protein-tyrosine-phosphatase [Limoniibacter endophyticus]
MGTSGIGTRWMMPLGLTIRVCPLAKLPQCIDRNPPSRLLSLLTQGTEMVRPEKIAAEDHLLLQMHDIHRPLHGMSAPAQDQVARMLQFARDWASESKGDLLVHCYAGVSRSPASAYAIACALRADIDERELAQQLRDASSVATPNPLIVALADDLLGREGRMVAAIKAIGRGAETFEGTVFTLSL